MVRVTPVITSERFLETTFQSPQENLLGTPETLPTSEPATPQVSYTIASGDLPTFSITTYAKKWIAYLYAAGNFVTAGTLSWRMKKNGISVNTGTSSVGANTYYTVNAFFYDVAVGDGLEIALWSNQSDSKYDYKAYFVILSRLLIINKPRIAYPCNFAELSAKPVLTQGNPNYVGQGAFYPMHEDGETPAITAPKVFDVVKFKDQFCMFRMFYGDKSSSNAAMVATHASYRPYYYRQFVSTKIKIRGLRLD